MENMNMDKGKIDGGITTGVAKLKEAALTAASNGTSTLTSSMSSSIKSNRNNNPLRNTTTNTTTNNNTVRSPPLTPLSTVWIEKHPTPTTNAFSTTTESGIAINNNDQQLSPSSNSNNTSSLTDASSVISKQSITTKTSDKVFMPTTKNTPTSTTVPKLLTSLINSSTSSKNTPNTIVSKKPPSTSSTTNGTTSNVSTIPSTTPISNVNNTTKSIIPVHSAFEQYRGKAKAWREEHKARVATESVLEQIGEASKTMTNERWRQRVGINSDTKVCIVSMAYPDIRDALLARGWKQNMDFESPHFDLKYVLKAKHANHRSLLNGQVVNHFEKSNAICTKAGLLKVLRSTHWFAPVNSHSIYPRAYDLADPTDYAEFVDDFRCVEAEKILRTTVTAILLAAVNAKLVHPDDLVPREHNTNGKASSISSIERGGAAAAAILGGSKVPFDRTLYLSSGIMKTLLSPRVIINFLSSATVPTFNLGVIKAALNITRKRCREWDDAMLDDPSLGMEPLVTSKEWEIIRYCDIFKVGGPVEQASVTLANEATLRANEEAENTKKDKQIKRMLKRKGQAAANAILTSTKSGKDVLTTTLAAVQNQQQKQQIIDQERNRKKGTEGNDDDDDSDNDDDVSDDVDDDESESDSDDVDTMDTPGGGFAVKDNNKVNTGKTGTNSETVMRNGEYKVLTGAVGSVQLRAWRDRLEKEGGDISIFNESIGDPSPTVSSLNKTDTNLNSLDKVNATLWESILEAIGLINDNYTCQSSLNGCPPKNVWIVKPAGKSRGRGIECESSLSGILNQRGGTNHKETHWIVQKYIERPLLIKNRKWDIRQWVLVTSWNPLTVWFYNKCYLRFCSYPFELGNLSNRYIHLSNNSIQKHSGAFDASDIEGNMWHMKDFAKWLQDRDKEGAWDGLTYIPQSNEEINEGTKNKTKHNRETLNIPVPPPSNTNDPPLVQDAAVLWNQIQLEKAKEQQASPKHSNHTNNAPLPVSGCSDIWGKILQPQIRRIVSWSLQSAQDTIDGRTGDFEIYGFDFMIDADLHPWLIEINSSPDFSYSTAVTEELVQEASDEIIQVVVDYKEWEKETVNAKQVVREAKKVAKQTNVPFSLNSLPSSIVTSLQASSPDTGNWELIYRSPLALGQVLTCTATGMTCVGTAIKVPNLKNKSNTANKLKQAALATVFASALRHKERTDKANNEDKSLNSSFSSTTITNDLNTTGSTNNAEIICNGSLSSSLSTDMTTVNNNNATKVPLFKARLSAATALDTVIQQQAQQSSSNFPLDSTNNRPNILLLPKTNIVPKTSLKLGTATFSFDTNLAFDNPPLSVHSSSSRPPSNGSKK